MMSALRTPFIIGRAFFDALVLMILWNWFAAPLGARTLTYWSAFGLDTLVGYAAVMVGFNSLPAEDGTYYFKLSLYKTAGLVTLLLFGLLAKGMGA